MQRVCSNAVYTIQAIHFHTSQTCLEILFFLSNQIEFLKFVSHKNECLSYNKDIFIVNDPIIRFKLIFYLNKKNSEKHSNWFFHDTKQQ